MEVVPPGVQHGQGGANCPGHNPYPDTRATLQIVFRCPGHATIPVTPFTRYLLFPRSGPPPQFILLFPLGVSWFGGYLPPQSLRPHLFSAHGHTEKMFPALSGQGGSLSLCVSLSVSLCLSFSESFSRFSQYVRAWHYIGGGRYSDLRGGGCQSTLQAGISMGRTPAGMHGVTFDWNIMSSESIYPALLLE